MGLKESFHGFFDNPEEQPKSKTAKTLEEFIRLWESDLGVTVCIQPSEIIKTSRGGTRSRTYSLNYSAETIIGDSMLLFQEKFVGFPDKNNHFRNFVTAIERVSYLKEIADIDAYIVKDGYLSDCIEPEAYHLFQTEAQQRGIKPFPLPIPKAFLLLH